MDNHQRCLPSCTLHPHVGLGKVLPDSEPLRLAITCQPYRSVGTRPKHFVVDDRSGDGSGNGLAYVRPHGSAFDRSWRFVDSDGRNAGGPYGSTSLNMGHSPSVHRNRSVLVRDYSAVTQEAVFERNGDLSQSSTSWILESQESR